MSRTKYAYADGVVKAREVKLLPESKLLRMAEASSFDASFEFLSESDCAEYLENRDFEKALEKELAGVKKLIKDLLPDFEKDEAKDAFYKNYLKAKADLTNIKSFIRIKVFNRESKMLKSAFIPGGIISENLLEKLFNEPLEHLPKALKHTPYFNLTEEGLNFYFKNHSFSCLERLMDNFLISYLKHAKYISLGIEPLTGYLRAKESEAQNIRMILTGKLNNLPPSVIKEHLRETYV